MCLSEAVQLLDDCDCPCEPGIGSLPYDPVFNGLQIPEDCTSFLGLDPSQMRIHARPGTLDIQITSSNGTSNNSELVNALHYLLEETPVKWNWLLNLTALRTFDLLFIDTLIAVGKYLHRQSGYLIIKGLRESTIPAAFLDLFQQRCQEVNIEVIWADARKHRNGQ